MKYILIFILVLSGCVTVPKAEKKLDSQPTESARYCSIRFPIKLDTVIVNDSIRFDSIYVPGDTIFMNSNSGWEVIVRHDTTYLFKVCPKEKIVNWYITRTITKTIEHTARIKYLEGLTAQKDQSITRLTKGRNTWRWVGLGSSILLFLLIVFFTLRATKTI